MAWDIGHMTMLLQDEEFMRAQADLLGNKATTTDVGSTRESKGGDIPL